MEFARRTLRDCHLATGTVVVIDVVRAFTTAAYAFAAGAREIVLTDSVDEAFALRQRLVAAGEETLLMGEVDGALIEGFDLGNSPAAVAGLDLRGRVMVQRTSAGTRGVVCASAGAEVLLPSSLVVGRATAAALRQLAPEEVTFVITGAHGRGPLDGDEDAACADYIEALLAPWEAPPQSPPYTPRGGGVETGRSVEGTAPYAQRVRESFSGRLFGDPAWPYLRAKDIDFCVDVDRFDFALRVEREEDLLVMRAVHV